MSLGSSYLLLNQLEVDDRDPELLARACSGHHLLNRLVHEARRRGSQGKPTVVEDRHRDLETLPGRSHEILFRNADLSEHHRRRRADVEAHLRHVLSNRDSLPIPFDEEGPEGSLLLGIHLSKDHVGPGIVGIGDVGFGAVEDVSPAVLRQCRLGTHIPRVRTDGGFRQGEGVDRLAACCFRQVALLLLPVSKEEQSHDADRQMGERHEYERHVHSRHRLGEVQVFGNIEAESAILCRHDHTEDPELFQSHQ